MSIRRPGCVFRSYFAGAVIAVSSVMATEGTAATYYVNNQLSSASDSNPGTESQPWRTLAKASTAVRPGDTVVVRPGTYAERVNFYGNNLGSATVPTTFRADPPRQAIMRGFDTLRAPHLKIEGFDITLPSSLISSDWTAKYAIFVRSDGVQLTNNYIHDIAGAGIHAYWVSPWPSNVVVRDNYLTRVNQGIVVQGFNWLVENNEVSRLVVASMDCDYMRFFGRNITIRRNYLHGARFVDIGNSHVDGFQTFPNNGWFAEDVVIDGNFVESFHQGAMVGVGDFQNQTGYIRNLTFTNNVFIGGEIGGSWGIQCINTPNVVVRNNLFMDMQYHGVGMRWNTSATVQSNIFVNCEDQNYWADDSSTMVGGYNVMDWTPSTPLYQNSLDRVADPKLISPANPVGPDGVMFTADDGYRLQPTSPAIDFAGGAVLAKDIFGYARPVGPKADSGPHEYGGTADGGGGGGEDPPSTAPATYYVNNQASNAADTNPGTETQPWRTLAKASAAVKPGDTVIVRPGTYNERVKFTGGNLSTGTVPTVFKSDPARGAVMRGFDTLDAPHLKVIGFDVSVPASLIASDATARYSIYVRSDGVEVSNNYIHDTPGVAVHASWTQPWPKDVVVRGNTMARVSQGVAIYGENWLVGENEIRQLTRVDMDCDYMRFFGRNIVIRRNFLHGSNSTDLAGVPVDAFQTFPNNGWYAEDVTIDANICWSFSRGAMLGGADYATQTGYVRNIAVTNNVFAGGAIVPTHGVHSAGVQNLDVRNNIFMSLGATATGVAIEAGSSASVQNNIFYNAGWNYSVAAGASMAAGYNILNRVPTNPPYTNALDIVADPKLKGPSNLLGTDGTPFTTDDGYLVVSGSPAIDRAGGVIASTDILGRARPYGAAGDIGPHEYRSADETSKGNRKKFRTLDTSKDGKLDRMESEFASDMEFDVVDTNRDDHLSMAELIEASLGLPTGHAETVWVVFSYKGPETGDAGTPFDTLDEGLAFVAPGGEVRIAGNASDRFVGAGAIKQGVKLSSLEGSSQIGVSWASPSGAIMLAEASARDEVAEGTSSNGDSIAARDTGADEGDLHASDDEGGASSGAGGIGSGGEVALDVLYEPVLPSATFANGLRVLSGAQPVALRLISDQPIGAEVVWAEVPLALAGRVTVDWVSHDSSSRDVWVRVTPEAPWSEMLGEDGATLSVSAGHGDAKVSFEFAALADAGFESIAPLDGGVGDAVTILPEEAYDSGVTVELPLPAGVTASEVDLMYYVHAELRWVAASQMVGFVASVDATESSIFVTANHAGTVQLRKR